MNGRDKVIRPLGLLVTCILASAALLAGVNIAVASGDHSIVVQEAQTLEQIVEAEIQSSRFAKQIATYNGYDAGTIVPIGAVIKIPEPYMQQRDFGQVVFAKGDVVHTQQAMVVNPPARGAYVHQGDRFSTGEDGFVSLKFSSGSVVNIQPESRVSITDIACVDEKVSCVIALNAEQGEIQSQVVPRPDGQPPVKFTVTTPFLSAAVRGTSFYVNVDKGADRIGVTTGLVATEVAGAANDLPEGKGLLARENVEPALVDLLQRPELMSSAGEVVYSIEDTVRWKAMEAAQQYRLTIAQDEGFTNPVLLAEVQESSMLLSSDLQPGEYYLSIAGVDDKKFPGLPTITQFTVAEIVDQEQLELQVNRSNGMITVESIDYTGPVELVISNDWDNPTEVRRIKRTLTEDFSLQLDSSQDWVVRARKAISLTSVSLYSDYYLLEAEN